MIAAAILLVVAGIGLRALWEPASKAGTQTETDSEQYGPRRVPVLPDKTYVRAQCKMPGAGELEVLS